MSLNVACESLSGRVPLGVVNLLPKMGGCGDGKKETKYGHKESTTTILISSYHLSWPSAPIVVVFVNPHVPIELGCALQLRGS